MDKEKISYIGVPYGAIKVSGERHTIAYVYSTPLGLVYSTSPAWLGISWTIGGPYKDYHGLLDDLCNANYVKHNANVVFYGLDKFESFEPAEIVFWTRRKRRRFESAFGAVGGAAAMINKQRGARLLDDAPERVYEEPPRYHDDDEWVLETVHGPRPQFKD